MPTQEKLSSDSSNKIPDPILITGCARSGTSLVAGIIHKHGAFGGEMRGPTQYNARGMFENSQIVNFVKNVMGGTLEVDPLGQYPLADPENLPELLGFGEAIIELLKQDGYIDGPWFYKGAKIPMLWPLWDKAFPNAKWLVVRRPTEAIVKSCKKAPFMRKVPADLGWEWWVEQHLEVFPSMKQHLGNRYREVWSADIIEGRLFELQSAIEWLGFSFDRDIVEEFVDPNLWHHE